jgi:hypothetical protein
MKNVIHYGTTHYNLTSVWLLGDKACFSYLIQQWCNMSWQTLKNFPRRLCLIGRTYYFVLILSRIDYGNVGRIQMQERVIIKSSLSVQKSWKHCYIYMFIDLWAHQVTFLIWFILKVGQWVSSKAWKRFYVSWV